MNFNDLTDSGAELNDRRAALLLHSMGEADRAWVLQALDEPERTALQALLGELAQLQITPDAQLLRHAMTALKAENTPAKPAVVGDREFLHHLNHHQVKALAESMAAEPPLLVAQCLNLDDWPWLERCKSLMHAAHRALVNEYLDMPDAAPAAGSPLANELLKQMRQICERALLVTTSPKQASGNRAVADPRGLRRWLPKRRTIHV